MKKVFSYFDDRTYNFLNETKANLILDGYTKSSLSRLVRIAVKQLENTDYDVIKEMMKKELI